MSRFLDPAVLQNLLRPLWVYCLRQRETRWPRWNNICAINIKARANEKKQERDGHSHRDAYEAQKAIFVGPS